MSIIFELLERMKIYTSIRIGKLMYSLNAVHNITFQLDMSPLFCIVVMVFLVFKRFVSFVKNSVHGWFGYEPDKLKIVKTEND